VATVHALGELAERIGGEVRGDPSRPIHGIATLDQAGPLELSFLTNPRYRAAAAVTRAGAVLLAPGVELAGHDLLVVLHPYAALARLLEIYHPSAAPGAGVSPDARIGPGATLGRELRIAAFAVIGAGCVLGDRVGIGAGSVLGDGCVVGDGTEIHPRVVLYPGTQVGRRCVIHSGVVLGSDGFGFATVDGRHHKVPQVGRVVVEDEVEIGANTAVDRAMLGETRIGAGSKIDDLVMVAHGVRIGAGALLAGQAGIAGSTRLGPGAVLAGQAGVAGHLELGERVVVGAKSAVLGDVAADEFVAGVPAIEHRRWKRSQALVQRLPELRRQLRDARSRIEALERERRGER